MASSIASSLDWPPAASLVVLTSLSAAVSIRVHSAKRTDSAVNVLVRFLSQ